MKLEDIKRFFYRRFNKIKRFFRKIFTPKKFKLSKDCWDLEYSALEWFYERLPVYLKEAGEFINLDYCRCDYDGERKTQRELIERMIVLLEKILADDSTLWNDSNHEKYHIEFWKIWGIVRSTMWW